MLQSYYLAMPLYSEVGFVVFTFYHSDSVDSGDSANHALPYSSVFAIRKTILSDHTPISYGTMKQAPPHTGETIESL